MRKLILVLGVSGLLSLAMAADKGLILETRVSETPPQRITLQWTSDTNGEVDVWSQPVRGKISRVEVYHGVSDTPTGGTYVVSLKTVNGLDVLAGQGAAVASNSVVAYGFMVGVLYADSAGVTNLYKGLVANEKLNLDISGVGSEKQGSITIYVE